VAYGSDISGVEDLDFGLSVVEGRAALVQAVARRYLSPRGGHRYARAYGLDLRAYLADPVPAPVAQSAIAAEARKDARVRSAAAVVTDDAETGVRTADVSIAPRDEGAAFRLTFTLDATTDELALLTASAEDTA
jgi:hypothetical protein